MKHFEHVMIGGNFCNTADIPKDRDIHYRCIDCGSFIASVPTSSTGCSCGNIFIDKDYWRLIVTDLSKLEAVKRISR